MGANKIILISIAIGLCVLIATASARPHSRRYKLRQRRSNEHEISKSDAVSVKENSSISETTKSIDIVEHKEGLTPPSTGIVSPRRRKVKKNHRNKHKRVGHSHHHKRKSHSHRIRNKNRDSLEGKKEAGDQLNSHDQSIPDILNKSPTVTNSEAQTDIRKSDSNDKRKLKRHHHRQHGKNSHKRLYHRRRLHKHTSAEELKDNAQ